MTTNPFDDLRSTFVPQEQPELPEFVSGTPETEPILDAEIANTSAFATGLSDAQADSGLLDTGFDEYFDPFDEAQVNKYATSEAIRKTKSTHPEAVFGTDEFNSHVAFYTERAKSNIANAAKEAEAEKKKLQDAKEFQRRMRRHEFTEALGSTGVEGRFGKVRSDQLGRRIQTGGGITEVFSRTLSNFGDALDFALDGEFGKSFDMYLGGLGEFYIGGLEALRGGAENVATTEQLDREAREALESAKRREKAYFETGARRAKTRKGAAAFAKQAKRFEPTYRKELSTAFVDGINSLKTAIAGSSALVTNGAVGVLDAVGLDGGNILDINYMTDRAISLSNDQQFRADVALSGKVRENSFGGMVGVELARELPSTILSTLVALGAGGQVVKGAGKIGAAATKRELKRQAALRATGFTVIDTQEVAGEQYVQSLDKYLNDENLNADEARAIASLEATVYGVTTLLTQRLASAVTFKNLPKEAQDTVFGVVRRVAIKAAQGGVSEGVQELVEEVASDLLVRAAGDEYEDSLFAQALEGNPEVLKQLALIGTVGAVLGGGMGAAAGLEPNTGRDLTLREAGKMSIEHKKRRAQEKREAYRIADDVEPLLESASDEQLAKIALAGVDLDRTFEPDLVVTGEGKSGAAYEEQIVTPPIAMAVLHKRLGYDSAELEIDKLLSAEPPPRNQQRLQESDETAGRKMAALEDARGSLTPEVAFSADGGEDIDLRDFIVTHPELARDLAASSGPPSRRVMEVLLGKQDRKANKGSNRSRFWSALRTAVATLPEPEQQKEQADAILSDPAGATVKTPPLVSEEVVGQEPQVVTPSDPTVDTQPVAEEEIEVEEHAVIANQPSADELEELDADEDLASPRMDKARSINIVRLLGQKFGVTREDVVNRIATVTNVDVDTVLAAEPSGDLADDHLQIRTIGKLLLTLNRFDTRIEQTTVESGYIHDFAAERGVTVYLFDGNRSTRGVALGRTAIALNANLTTEAKARATLFHEFVHVYQEENPEDIAALAQLVRQIAPKAVERELYKYASGFSEMNDQRRANGLEPLVLDDARLSQEAPAVLANVVADFIAADDTVLDFLSQQKPGVLARFLDAMFEFLGYKNRLSEEQRNQVAYLANLGDDDFTVQQKVEVAQLYKNLFRTLTNSSAYPETSTDISPNFDVVATKGSPMLAQHRRMRTKLQSVLDLVDKDSFSAQELREQFDKDPSLRREADFRGFESWYEGYVSAYKKQNPATKKLPKITREAIEEWVEETQPAVSFNVGGGRTDGEANDPQVRLAKFFRDLSPAEGSYSNPNPELGPFKDLTGQYVAYNQVPEGENSLDSVVSEYTGIEYTEVEARVAFRAKRLIVAAGIGGSEPEVAVGTEKVTEVWGKRKGLPMQPVLHPSGKAMRDTMPYDTYLPVGAARELLKSIYTDAKIFETSSGEAYGVEDLVELRDFDDVYARINVTGPVPRPLGMDPNVDLSLFADQEDAMSINRAFAASTMFSDFNVERTQQTEVSVAREPLVDYEYETPYSLFAENEYGPIQRPSILVDEFEIVDSPQLHAPAQYQNYWYGGSYTEGFDNANSNPVDYREVRLATYAGGKPYIGSHFGERNVQDPGTLVLGSEKYLDEMTGNKNYIAHYRRDLRTDSVSGQKTLFVGEMQFDYQGDKHKYGVFERKKPRSYVKLEDVTVRQRGDSFIITNTQTGDAVRLSNDSTMALAEYTDRPLKTPLSMEDAEAIAKGMYEYHSTIEQTRPNMPGPLQKLFASKIPAKAGKEIPALPFGDSLSARQRAKAGYLDLLLKQLIKDAVDSNAESIAIPYGSVVDMLWTTPITYDVRFEYDPDTEVLVARNATEDSEKQKLSEMYGFKEKTLYPGLVKETPIPDEDDLRVRAARVPMKKGKLSAFAVKSGGFANFNTPILNSIIEKVNAGQTSGRVTGKKVGDRNVNSDLAPAQDRLLSAISDFFTKGAGRGLGTVVRETTDHGLLRHDTVEAKLMVIQLTNKAIETVQDQNSDLYIANMDVSPFDDNGDDVEETSKRGNLEGYGDTPESKAVNSFLGYMTGIEEGMIPSAVPRPGSALADAMEIETGEGDLRPRSAFFGNILHPALRSKSQVIRSTASRMTDLEILTRKVEETQSREDQRWYDSLPRAFRSNRGEKFFDLMDKVRVAPHEVDTNEKTKNLPSIVRRVLAHFKSRGEDMRLAILEQKREGIRKVAQYATQQGIVDIANQNLPEDRHWRLVTFQGKTGTTQRIVDSDNNTLTKAEAAEAVGNVAVSDDYGYQFEHIHHAFFGKYRVGYVDQKTYDDARKRGQTHYQARRAALTTMGSADSYAEAAHKIAQIRKQTAGDKALNKNALRTDEGEVLFVALPSVQINDQVTQRLTTAQHGKLLSELQNAADLTSDEVFALTRGIVGTKKSKNVFYAALLERTGAEGYSKDFLRVWSLQTRGFHRFVLGRKLRDYVLPRTEEMRARGLHQWANHFEQLVEFAINPSGDAHISGVEKTLDSVLSKVFGGSSDNEKGLFRGLLPLGHRPLRRMLHLVRSTMYLLTLKTVRQYAVNSFQPLQTVYPVVGEAGFVKAIALYNTPKGKKLIRDYGALADPSAFRDSPSGGGFVGTRGLRRIRNMASSVLPYLPIDVRSEVRNQNFAFLALYLHGKRIGLSDAAAAEFGRVRGVVMTQYAFTRTTQPPIMRGPVAATALQYKRFLINQVQLAYGFYKRGFQKDQYGTTGYGALTRFMALQLILGGVRGLIPFGFYNMGKSVFCKFLPEYCAGGPPEDDLEQFRQWVKEASGNESLANGVAHGVLAGALGIDISGSLALLDRPYGRNLSEQVGNTILGPAANTVIRAVTDQNQKLSQDKSALEVLGGSLLDSSPAVKAIYEFVDALSDAELQGKKMFNNRGEFLYEATVKDRFFKMMAFRTMKETEVSAMYTHYEAVMRVYDSAADQIATILADPKPNREHAHELMMQHNAMYPEFKIYIGDLTNRINNKIKNRTMPRGDRFIDSASNKYKDYLRRRYGTSTQAVGDGQ